MSCLGKRGAKACSELKRLMGVIDREATAKGMPPKKVMSQVEENSCFAVGQSGVNIPRKTHTGRPRNVSRLTWSSALKYMPKGK